MTRGGQSGPAAGFVPGRAGGFCSTAAPRAAEQQHEHPQQPETGPDAKRPADAAHKRRQKRARKPHCRAGHAGGEPLAPGVPFLSAGQHGRGQKCAAHPGRQAIGEQEQRRVARRRNSRQQKTGSEQCGAPQRRKPRAARILHKAAHRAADAVAGHKQRKNHRSLGTGEGVSLHDRTLEHTPGRRDAGQQLDGRPGRQNLRRTRLLLHRPVPFRGRDSRLSP